MVRAGGRVCETRTDPSAFLCWRVGSGGGGSDGRALSRASTRSLAWWRDAEPGENGMACGMAWRKSLTIIDTRGAIAIARTRRVVVTALGFVVNALATVMLVAMRIESFMLRVVGRDVVCVARERERWRRVGGDDGRGKRVWVVAFGGCC